MKKIVLRFENNCKIHIGEELYDYISSDKLYSMLINALSYLYDECKLQKKIFDINNEVRISSAFPGIRITKDYKKNDIDFLPKPYILIRKSELTSEEEKNSLLNRKKYKGISWISKKTYKKLSKNFYEKEDYIDYSFEDGFILGGKYYFEDRDVSKETLNVLKDYTLLRDEYIQRNLINRYNKKSEDTYYSGYKVLCYREDKGVKVEPYFYFYIDDKNDILTKKDIKSMEFISLGGKRSLGAGVVKKVEMMNEPDISLNSDRYINISMIYPKQSEVNRIEKYSLENRNGFVFSKGPTNIKKPTIRMIKEGSIFSDIVEGDIYTYNTCNIDHDIYVFGKAFLLPFGGDLYELFE